MPEVSERAAAVPADEELSVMTLPELPVAEKLLTVCVVPAVNVTVFGAPMVRVLKVLFPEKIIEPVPPPVIVKLL